MKLYPHIIQNSEEWFAMRKGRPTASQFKRIITPAKGDYSKSATEYMIDLVAECYCPTYVEFVGNVWTDRGTELEPEARDAFREHTGLEVDEVGFATRDDGIVGCSPDGLVKADGKYVAGLEIKCPAPRNHVAAVYSGTLPDEYKAQVHGGMAVTGLDAWHFWSYYPGMKPLHLLIERDEYTAKVEAALDRFWEEYAVLRLELNPKLTLEVTE